jgi:hypothetical protein
MDEEFRVEVELGDEDHHLSLGERLHALDLDDEAQKRLGSRVVITRDGGHMFMYAATRESAAEAERVVRELMAAEGIPGDVRATRWHPVAHEWVDADQPLPETTDAVAAEEREHDEAEEDQLGLEDDPRFIQLSKYKPKFLRDLGL